jgi:hypothetical protein
VRKLQLKEISGKKSVHALTRNNILRCRILKFEMDMHLHTGENMLNSMFWT